MLFCTKILDKCNFFGSNTLLYSDNYTEQWPSGYGTGYPSMAPGSKRLDGSKGDSAFHPPKVNQVPGTPVVLVVKSKLSPRSGSAALRQVNPIHEKGP